MVNVFLNCRYYNFIQILVSGFFKNCISRKCMLLNASEDTIFKNKQFFKSMDHIYK